jgi:hypothetical protein
MRDAVAMQPKMSRLERREYLITRAMKVLTVMSSNES